MVAVGLVGVAEEEDRPCSLVEVLLAGPRRAQQGGLGKENLDTNMMKTKNFYFDELREVTEDSACCCLRYSSP